jgi:hypothetical protein
LPDCCNDRRSNTLAMLHSERPILFTIGRPSIPA